MPCLFCERPVVRDVALLSDDSIAHAGCARRHSRRRIDQRLATRVEDPLRMHPRWLAESRVFSANSSSRTGRFARNPDNSQ